MHVSGFPFDLSPLLPYIFTALLIAIALLQLVKSTASKYFVVDANFKERGQPGAVNPETQMIAVAGTGDGCAVCGSSTTTRCSGCKRIRYCSISCQSAHWRAGHKLECKELKSFVGQNATVSAYGGRASVYDSKSNKQIPQLEKVLFPYEDFVKLFNWENMRFSPCGLLNCGNSCYANVVLQCLSSTRPLVAYLLEIRHVRKCRRNDWCFLCELEAHVDRARHSCQPFSPINILSRLPNIGGNLGYGKQEDAHEFMRFAIDTMQSVCLDEFGGEKGIHPSSQETTLIQYIFGGQLQSQVKCSKCHKISYRHENMMDLTVEIQGDAESLEKCLDQFTAEEWLDGENMYKCDGCNDYVKACKRLAIHQAPNILTIALKRFQSGRFGKLNKRVTFPETLDLGPYMSEPGCDSDIYRLYAVVVHIDMLNASYFGHYICYVKDFCGHWYRIDDCKVETVELEEVLSQGAYMLLYSRISVRPSCVKSPQICKEENQQVVDMVEEAQPCTSAVESITIDGSVESFNTVVTMPTDVGSPVVVDKQQGKNISEETQPCAPVFESINVVGSVSSLSNMTTDARSPTVKSTEKDDVVCMNVDDSVKVDTRFVEDATTSIADVLFDSKSSLMDMDLDAPNRLDVMPAGGDEMDIDLGNPDSSSLGVKVDECGTSQSDTAEIVSGGEIFHGEVLGSVPLREATLVEACSLDCDIVSGSNSEDHSSEERSRTRGEVISNEISSLPQSAICELADSSCSPALILQGNSSDYTAKPLTGVPAASISEKRTSKPARDKSCSNGKQRPLFSVGFLDKRPKCKPPIKTEAVLAKPGEVGLPCKVSNNSNGITKPVVSQHTNVVHNHNGFCSDDQHGCVVGTDCNGFTKAAARQNVNVAHDHNGIFNSDGQNTPSVVNRTPEKCSSRVQLIEDCIRVSSQADPVDKCSNKTASEAVGSLPSRIGDEKNDTSSKGKQNSLFAAGFLDKRIRSKSQNGDGRVMVKSSDVGVSCKPHSKCNGFTNHSQSINVVHEGNVRSQNGNGSVLVKPGEVGVSCKLDRNCNGMTTPLASQSINMVDGNGKSEYGKGNVLVKPGEVGASCRLDSDCNGSTEPVASGGINLVHHGNGTFHSERQHSPSQCAFIGEVGYSCEGKNMNGFANPGSLPNNTEDHNYDRNFECHNLVKSSKYIGDQCDDTSIDDGEQEDGKRDVCTRDFLNNASRKKFLKKEGPSLSDSRSCNKLPRVG